MKIHFIGIGGIGVSALANYFLQKGASVSGSDLSESEIINDLKKMGAKIPLSCPFLKGGGKGIGHRAENVPVGTGLVVYSAAVTKHNPEFKEAKRRKIKCQTYAQALGELTKEYFTIAVSGTHGKSTTTAMVALILIEAGLDPTVIVGTKLREFGNSNFRMGNSKYLIIEADEYEASFLNCWPKIIVLTNIEEDHLDYYRDINHIVATFGEYVGHLSKGGVLVANGEDKNIASIIQKSKVPPAPRLRRASKIQNFSLGFKIDNLKLRVPGRHNLMNAAAAMSVARVLGIRDKISVKALNKFKGTWRRFEYKGQVNGAKIFDDYGHHPTEIKATLQGAREFLTIRHKPYATSHLWCVFQPHQYERTYKLFDEFAAAFDEADKVVLLPIYSVAGREKESIKKKVSSEKLVQRLRAQGRQGVVYCDSFEKAADFLCKNLKRGDIAIIMGAGDIYKMTELLTR